MCTGAVHLEDGQLQYSCWHPTLQAQLAAKTHDRNASFRHFNKPLTAGEPAALRLEAIREKAASGRAGVQAKVQGRQAGRDCP